MAEVDPAHRQHLLDDTQAQRKTKIKADRMTLVQK
ncbi:hypothetical protein N825_32565 [Skermanella stibiiresistens SB22]|uniref:Uncharacterized protein n=1 Tax=Skermanella stibiiresistens SB22 TaxID=1385369 RepID=W9GPQ2_9PROT|nr:hypothetical protein N825_32565 [Skermanella stibiiresistens SB22]